VQQPFSGDVAALQVRADTSRRAQTERGSDSRPLPADLLVGRLDELRCIERILDDLDRGRPGAIELVGEPGIGKTRLLKEIGLRAEQRAHLVLSGSASELERDLPFSVFVDAVDEYVKGLAPNRLATLDKNAQAELPHVLPSLPAQPDARQALQQERYRSHRAVKALLEHLADTRPLVLMLDDIHWADLASVELLGAMLRRPPAAAVLLALARRPRHVSSPLAVALERAHRTAALTRIELGPLTRVEAKELLGRSVNSADLNVLYEESGGNPFYLEQLARTVERTDVISADLRAFSSRLGIPAAVGAALNEELAALSTTGRRLLDAAAVAGDPFELELATAAAALSESAATDGIDELLQLDLISETDVPRRFRFRHPLVRRATYAATAPGWRLGAHERCAEALSKQGASAASRAHHLEYSARIGDLAAVAVLREAGEGVGRLAPASAARWFGAALRLLPDTSANDERLSLLLVRARNFRALGQLHDAHADLLECIPLAEHSPVELRVRITTMCAAVEHQLGLQKVAHSHLTTALAELRDDASADAVQLMTELTVDASFASDFGAMRDWAARAVAAATRAADDSVLASALALRAWAGAFAGDGAAAQRLCDEATELVDALSDEEAARQLNALAHLATADLYLDRFVAAGRHAQRALEIGRASGQGDLLPDVVGMLGGALWVQGRPIEAEELFDGAVEAARLADNAQSLAWNLFNHSYAALVAGHIELALATAAESFDLTGDMAPGILPALAGAVLASALLEAGQIGRSVEVLVARAGGEELPLIGGGWRSRFLELLTRSLLAAGRRTDAEHAVAAAQACGDAVGLPTARAMANVAAARLALDAGYPAAAAHQALAAVDALESVAAFFDAARARELAGRAYARLGDTRHAVHELELAAAAFDAFGSVRYRNQAERELRKLGRHIHRRTQSGTSITPGIAALTARELAVARLAGDGKTNPQIAAELFLSKKTVETHLSNIFRKLDVSSRVGLVRTLDRADRD
jgi:DNA-binding NarL/FixJ family response regulator/tetratricopeptide (TPR) repeat protein